ETCRRRTLTAKPCSGSSARIFRISRSSVPWTRSDGLLMMFHLGYRYIGYREYRRGPQNLVSDLFHMMAATRSLPDPPAIARTAMQELLGCHYAVALEDQPVLHHEYHGAQRVDVLQRVSLDRDYVGGKSGLERASLVVHVADFVAVDRHDLQDLLVRDASCFP